MSSSTPYLISIFEKQCKHQIVLIVRVSVSGVPPCSASCVVLTLEENKITRRKNHWRTSTSACQFQTLIAPKNVSIEVRENMCALPSKSHTNGPELMADINILRRKFLATPRRPYCILTIYSIQVAYETRLTAYDKRPEPQSLFVPAVYLRIKL